MRGGGRGHGWRWGGGVGAGVGRDVEHAVVEEGHLLREGAQRGEGRRMGGGGVELVNTRIIVCHVSAMGCLVGLVLVCAHYGGGGGGVADFGFPRRHSAAVTTIPFLFFFTWFRYTNAKLAIC